MAENLNDNVYERKCNIVYEQKCGLALPYFDLFCQQLDKNTEEVMYAFDLHAQYVSQVDKKTCDEMSMKSANGYRRFCVDFAAYARKHHIVKVTTPKSGYIVKLNYVRYSRVVRHHNTYVLPSEIFRYLLSNSDLRESTHQIPATRTVIPGGKGYGLIADRHIPDGGFVCQYIAQRLTEAEFEERNVFYDYFKDIYLPTDVHVNKIVFDGYCDEEGHALDKSDNWGTQLNHDKKAPNCVMKRIEVGGVSKLFLFAKTGIPKGRELVWNYDDSRRGLEPWLNN